VGEEEGAGPVEIAVSGLAEPAVIAGVRFQPAR
jgi:hypothetical protein